MAAATWSNYPTPMPPPIFDRCPYCKLPVQPGEVHGEVVPAGTVPLDLNNYGGIMRVPQVRCRIKKLVYVEDVIETPSGEQARLDQLASHPDRVDIGWRGTRR